MNILPIIITHLRREVLAYKTMWYGTQIPEEIVTILESDLKSFDHQLNPSVVSSQLIVDKNMRNSQNTWIPTTHWLGGFIWYYAQRANRENFLYDLTTIDDEQLQYTVYNEGCYYHWHIDAGIASSYKPQTIIGSAKDSCNDSVILQAEYVRKLSFSLQLSDENDYTGGDLQFLDIYHQNYFAPKKRGTLVFFDSRIPHRVRKIKSGTRKSIVGWIIGPRWK